MKELSLRNNKIEALPISMSKMTSLRILNLDGNPLRVPPKEVAKRGLKEIMGYLKDLSAGSSTIYRTKLMIVGQGKG